MQKRDAGERNSASRLKRHFDSACHSPIMRPARNALRAAVESGFSSARYAVQIALFAPVEYLTYGSRNSRRVFRLPRQLNKNASVARLDNLKQFSHKTSPGENPRKGAAAPFLVVLRGLQRGKAPTRIQRSDSCGKRRNNGTDEACPPQAADRVRDVEFVPTQLPLDYSFFRPSTALSFSYEKESGVENAPAEAFRSTNMACGTLCRQRTLSPVRLQVVHPVIFASANCPSRQSGPLMRTSRPPSVRAVSSSPSLPSTSTRIVLPT